MIFTHDGKIMSLKVCELNIVQVVLGLPDEGIGVQAILIYPLSV